jgi:hypothetical protein
LTLPATIDHANIKVNQNIDVALATRHPLLVTQTTSGNAN